MKSLENTVLYGIYNIIGADSDAEIIQTINIGIFIWTIIAIFVNIFAPIPYGKSALQQSKSGSTPFWNYSLSSKFVWRYGFIWTIIVPLFMMFLTPCKELGNFCNWVGLAIFMTHYFNRTIIYPSKISPKAQPQTLWFFLLMVLATSVCGFYQSHHLMNVHKVDVTYLTYIGIASSVLGSFVNSHHDTLLTNLRSETKSVMESKSKDEKKGSNYRIPRGGLFEYVSCANYFGELMEWWGLAMVTKGAPQILFAVWSTSFLVLRARFTHKFYQKMFGTTYPPNRKAIIPFIY